LNLRRLNLRSPAALAALGVTATLALALMVVITLQRSDGAKAVSDNAALIGALVALGGVFTAQMVSIALDDRRTRESRELEAQRAHETAVQNYFEQVGKLLIEKPLLRASPGDNLSTVVRAQTLAVIEGLDPGRKRILLQFLYESGLINKDKQVVVLEGAKLSGAMLSSTRLMEADLSGTFLGGTDLSSANMSKANLAGADLIGADLSGAELSEANLGAAYLIGADLSGAELSEANLGLADLIGADLSRAFLRETNLRLARLMRADLSEANLSGANLSGANLSGANLSEANLTDADLSRADLSNAKLVGATLIDTYLRDANLTGANLSGAKEIGNMELKLLAKSVKGATMPDGTKHD
jgi:uncharacterized protein YjbI with pentapeptide repeats